MVREMWCSSCTKRQPVQTTDLGLICCTGCGKILDQDIFSDEPTFSKNNAGQSQMSGNIINSVQSNSSASRERTLQRAYDFIIEMVENMGVGGGDQTAQPAVRFYEIAVEKNFVRGRRADQVAAACLYIACRNDNKPFLLIEFSEYLRINVYVLGAVFLQLCRVLHLQEHPILQKPVDPSLFIHRFSNGLLGNMNHDVEKTALRIMTSMKRDWMQTGRKPSGLCGAALYISALSHGFTFSKADIVKIVHICEATLTKRLIEFEGTESGSLTIEEFNQKALEHERNNNPVKHANYGGSITKEGELLCEHRDGTHSHFAHGLCETCYNEFIKISGGLDGGSEPPAFQRAERERLAKASASDNVNDSLLETAAVESICKRPNMENETRQAVTGVDQMKTTGPTLEQEAVDGAGDMTGNADYIGAEGDESDSFSDIDDAEVDGYLHNEEETQYKKIIWEKVNWEYLEEQAAKEAAGIANLPKSKKERQPRKATEAKKPQTASEAAHQMLTKKRVSSKLNHDRLKALFDEPLASDSPKKSRTEFYAEKNVGTWASKNEVDSDNNADEVETMDEYEERNSYEDYKEHSYINNNDEDLYDFGDDEFF